MVAREVDPRTEAEHARAIMKLSSSMPDWLKTMLIVVTAALGGLLAVRGLMFGCHLFDWLLVVLCAAVFAMLTLGRSDG